MEYSGLLAICVGVGLASACGFRVFVPLLALSIGAKMGLVTLVPGFEWVSTDTALMAFGVATAVEMAAYYIPWIDNVLDFITTPMAMVAGVVVILAVFADVPPVLRWGAAVVAGAGTSGFIGVATGLTRAGSTMTTGGLANWLLATFENVGAIVTAILAIVVPILGALFVIMATVFFIMAIRRFRRIRSQRAAAAPA